jgi:hypothetical protein
MFSKTKVITNNRSSSILIKFDDSRGVSEFSLPVGFLGFPEDSYEMKKELFFQTYHTYRKFITEKRELAARRKLNYQTREIIDLDTVTETNEKFEFKDGITGEVITYQKLIMFDSILDAYDELIIQSLQEKLSKSEVVDYSKVHRYLHQAVFLRQNDAIYIDEIDVPKKIIKDASTELVEMFCYIYSEIVKEFGYITENHKVIALSNNFKENRLFAESALFAEETYSDTIEILKEVLDEIDQTTSYKDFDYWQFYDAIYNFIYSNNDGTWSLDSFSYIWERMCIAYSKHYYKRNIALYDDFGMLHDGYNGASIKKHFQVRLNARSSKGVVRYIRPDLILRDVNFTVADDFLEQLYHIYQRENEIYISYRKDVDMGNYSDIDSLKKSEFKDKPRIQASYAKWGSFPRTFTVTPEEFQLFKIRARELILQKKYFELAVRHPCVINAVGFTDEDNSYLVVDFKYMDEPAFSEHLDTQIDKAVQKQFVYELALKLNRNAFTRSEFWIPSYIPSRADITKKVIRRYSKACDPFFRKFRISVIQLDFLSLQKIYIQNDI